MTPSKIFILVSILFITQTTFSQEWMDIIKQENPNYFEAKKSYENYWKNRTFKKDGNTRIFNRWLRQNKRFVDKNGFINKEPNKAAIKKHIDNLVQKRKARGKQKNFNSTWKLVSPNLYKINEEKTRGQNHGLGVIWDVKVDPNNENTIYVGCHAGGLWKSTDKGKTWNDITNNIPTESASYGLEIMKGSPNTLFTTIPKRGVYPEGVYKSINGGDSWSKVYDSSVRIKAGKYVDNTLIGYSGSGFYKLNASGEIYKVSNISGASIKDVDYHPTKPNTFYCLADFSGRETLFKSTDGGLNFNEVGTGLPRPEDPKIKSTFYSLMAVSADAPNNVYVMSTGETTNGQKGTIGLYVSTDEGATFTKKCCGNGPGAQDEAYSITNPNAQGYSNTGSSSGGQLGYCSEFEVSDTDANTMIMSGINPWISTDGGANFTCTVGSWAYSFGLKRWVHADVQGIAINGDDIWISSDGGLYYSNDGTQTFVNKGEGIHNHTITGIDWPFKTLSHVGLATWHTGIAHYAGDNSKGIIATHGADSRGAIINPIIPDMAMDPNYVSYIDNEGRHRIAGSNSIDDANYGWAPNAVFHERKSNILYRFKRPNNTSHQILETTIDNSSENKSNHTAKNKIVYEGPEGSSIIHVRTMYNNPNVFYIVQKDPVAILRSYDHMKTWENVNLPHSNTYDIQLDALDENILWAATGEKKVYKSTDKGATWVDYTANLPNLYPYTLKNQIGTNGGIYLSNEVGVHYRDNSMDSWMYLEYTSPIFRVGIDRMKPFYPDGKIIASARGGLWQRDLVKTDVKPVANIKMDTDTIYIEGYTAKAKFYDYSALIEKGKNAKLVWEFEGANEKITTARNPVVTYTKPGKYKVKLTVSNIHGSHTKTDTVVVIAKRHKPEFTEDFIDLSENFVRVNKGNVSWRKVVTVAGVNKGETFEWLNSRHVDNTVKGAKDHLVTKKSYDFVNYKDSKLEIKYNFLPDVNTTLSTKDSLLISYINKDLDTVVFWRKGGDELQTWDEPKRIKTEVIDLKPLRGSYSPIIFTGKLAGVPESPAASGWGIFLKKAVLNGAIFIPPVNNDGSNSVVEVYPNPIKSGKEIIIKAPNEIEKMELFNLLGKRIAILDERKISPKKIEIKLKTYASGVYLLNVKIKGLLRTITKKIIVE